MGKLKVSSTKRFWKYRPGERRKVKILQTLVDHNEEAILEASYKDLNDKLLYGFTEQEARRYYESR